MTITLSELTEWNQRVFRNIQGIALGFDEFDDLTNDPKAKIFAHRVAATSESRFRLNELQFNAIDFVFKQTSWLPSRFGNGKFPVWYGSANLETSFHETLFHWQRIYLDAPLGFAENKNEIVITLRTVFTVNCNAALIDLRNKTLENPELVDPDTKHYPHAQQIGLRIHKEGHPGLITKSARLNTGENIAVFKQEILSAAEYYQDYIYEFDLEKNKILVKQKDSQKILLET